MGQQPGVELVFGMVAGQPLDEFSAGEQQQGGDAQDLVFRNHLGIGVRIDFEHFEGAGPLIGELLDQGIQHLAGTAPDGGEIDEDGQGSMQDFGLECFLADFG